MESKIPNPKSKMEGPCQTRAIPLPFFAVAKRLEIKILRLAAFWLGLTCLASPSHGDDGLSPLRKKFAEFPKAGLKQTPILPTPNENLHNTDYLDYAARTPGNETYGRPGWTRNFGGRFHKGVDILPTKWTTTGESIQIEYVDNKTRGTFTRVEKVKVPQDEIYAILDGKVVVENTIENRSGYGKYVIIEHEWADGRKFLSMYCHLSRIDVDRGDEVLQGKQIGVMGQTSNNSGGRRFLKVIPHMHFELGKIIDQNFGFTKASRKAAPTNFSGKYDPRNMQPYHPLEFLKEFKAIPYSEFKGEKKPAEPEKKVEETPNVKTEEKKGAPETKPEEKSLAPGTNAQPSATP
jgi:murein DD-endopeptidase MepM/ murein hydrolase activator NlpD